MESKLLAIQTELKAPKNQRNNFGNYNYRSQEDILEAAKPLLRKHGLVLTIMDEIVNLGNRFYVKATASLMEGAGILAQVSAFAREEETKKGMDAAQITGSASSYARKYALNGLFLIDDTKDSDATNTHGRDEKPATARPEAKKGPITVLDIIRKAKVVEDGGAYFVKLLIGEHIAFLSCDDEKQANCDLDFYNDLITSKSKVRAELEDGGDYGLAVKSIESASN